RRSKSSKDRSPRHGAEINGETGKKWPSTITAVQKKQMKPRTRKRLRPSQCIGGAYQENVEARMTKALRKTFCHSDFARRVLTTRRRVIPSSLGIRHSSLTFGCHSPLATYRSS